MKKKSKIIVASALVLSMLVTSAPAFAVENVGTVSAPPAEQSQEPPVMTDTQPAYNDGHYVGSGGTSISGLLLVNKKYSLPASYAPSHAAGAGQSLSLYGEAQQAMQRFLADCNAQGNSMYVLSAYRSYNVQAWLFQSYAQAHGVDKANTFSARAGQSEHQTGLSFDVGDAQHSAHNLEISIERFPGVQWMMAHCADYGFILRFPKGKESITGYQYEPWHFRYVGVNAAKEIMASGMTLEEFVGATGERKIALGRSDNALCLNEVRQEVSSYVIDELNYFRLRDLASLLEGTEAQFQVGYDAEQQLITITTHTPNGDRPSYIRLNRNDIAKPNPVPVLVNGSEVSPQAYNIDNFTYFKLRDLAALLGFHVEWDSTTSSMVIDTEREAPIASLLVAGEEAEA